MIANEMINKKKRSGFGWDLALLRENDPGMTSELEVLSCRSGDDSICAGRRIAVGAGVDRDVLDDGRPLLAVREDGVSLLSARYRRATGVILYWRATCPPDAVSRVIQAEALPRRYRAVGFSPDGTVGVPHTGDEAVYRTVSDMIDAEEALLTDALFNGTASRMLTVGQICAAIECFTELVGCDIELDLPTFVCEMTCYQTAATDVLLLYGLMLIRQFAATRGGICRVRTMGGVNGGRLVVELEMTPYDTENRPEETSSFRYMRACAEENGMELDAALTDGIWRMTLACLCDPARELSGDLKTENQLL